MFHEHEVLPWARFAVHGAFRTLVAPSGWISPISIVLLVEGAEGEMRSIRSREEPRSRAERVDRSNVEPLCQYDLVGLVSRPSVTS
jgi:hypothetical protein